jgi:hypothetical protein
MKIEHKVWIVLDAATLADAHKTPDAARKEAEALSTANIGKQFVVFEAENVHEAFAESHMESLYRNWDAEKKPGADESEAPVSEAPPPPPTPAPEVAPVSPAPVTDNELEPL